MLILLLHGLLTCVTAQMSGPDPKISPNITHWAGPRGGPHDEMIRLANDRRLWERGDLDNAFASLSLQRLGPLMMKLNSGQPIVVVSFGSSIAQDLGGIFYTDENLKAFTGRLGVPNHDMTSVTFYGTFTDQKAEADNGLGFKWASYFMRMVNTTWPHVHHSLINYGRAAAALKFYVDLPCLAELLPNHLDLILIESVFLNKDGTQAEDLLTRLADIYRGNVSAMPAIIVIQTPLVVDHKARPESEQCLRDATQCATLCGPNNAATTFQHILDGDYYAGTSSGNATTDLLVKEHDIRTLAAYYGYPLISYRLFLVAALRDGVHTRHKLSECEFLAGFQGDAINPRTGLGTQLWSELLFNVLYQAELFFQASPSFLTRLPGIPTKPLFRRDHVKFPACVETRPGNLPGALSAIALPGTGTGTSPGWEWHEYQQDSNIRKHKPGWISKTPGSALEIQVSTSEGGVASNSAALVVLSYLASYQHMGQAAVACVAGCKCADSVIEGHLSMHVSVPKEHEFSVTASDKCTVQVTVLQTTQSGGTKVKVLSVLTKVVTSSTP